MLRIIQAIVLTLVILPVVAVAQTYINSSGEVIANARLIAVYLGPQPSGFESTMNRFYRRITASSYFLPLDEYALASDSPLSKVTYERSVSLPVGFPPGGTVDTLSLARFIELSTMNGMLPEPVAETIYVVHISASLPTIMGLNIFGIPAGSPVGSGFCAYHFTTRRQQPFPLFPSIAIFGPKIRIAVVPEHMPSSCMSAPITGRATHEIVETITNPDSVILDLLPAFGAMAMCNGAYLPAGAVVPLPGVASGPPPINGNSNWAWNNPNTRSNLCNPNEVADTCTYENSFQTTPDPSGAYTVSGIFSNAAGSCLVSTLQGNVDETLSLSQCRSKCKSEEQMCLRDLREVHGGQNTPTDRQNCAAERKQCTDQCSPS